MDYSDIYDAVTTLSKRPDLTDETRLAIQKATLKMHGVDFFVNDVVEKVVTLPSAGFLFAVDKQDNFPRYRAAQYFRKYDPAGYNELTQQTTGAGSLFFDYCPPDKMLDSYKQQKVDVWYPAGSVITFRSSTSITQLLAGYYAFPSVRPITAYSSWIANDFPEAIITEALCDVFRFIGYIDELRRLEKLSLENIQMLQMMAVTGKGF